MRRVVGELPARNDCGWYAVVLGALQGVGSAAIAYYDGYIHAVVVVEIVDDILTVSTAAAYEYGKAYLLVVHIVK